MEQNLLDKIKQSISNIDEKKMNIYFFVQDTKGNAKASLKYIYDMALSLKQLGYQPKVDLEMGIKKTIEWYNERNML